MNLTPFFYEMQSLHFTAVYWWLCTRLWFLHGPLARYVKLWVAHAPGMPGTFSPPPQVNDPDMHHGTCITHVPLCMPRSITSGFLWSRWQGKRFRHSRHILRIWQEARCLYTDKTTAMPQPIDIYASKRLNMNSNAKRTMLIVIQ